MDELIKETLDLMRLNGGQGSVLALWEVLFAMALCLVCSIFTGWIYRYTHRDVSYSQSFVQTLVLTSLVTSLIMVVIGSNIARAFSLVGALSIIRFRNAVKETRDVGFIFFAMAIAMACGTRFYGVAVMATLFIGSVLLLMHITDYGKLKRLPERLLRIQLVPELEPDVALRDVLERFFESHSLVSVETVRQGMYNEITYFVRPRPGVNAAEVVAGISEVNGNLKISYATTGHVQEL